MSDIDIKTTHVRVPNQDLRTTYAERYPLGQAPPFEGGDASLQIDAYLAQPAREGKFAAVIVFQEIFGVNSNIREIAELIAQQGYVAIAPAMYQRIAPGFSRDFSPQDLAYSPEAYQLGLQYYQQVKYREIFSDIRAAIAYLKTLPNVKADAIGCIGFCFGGHVAYMAATLPDIKATASFYGGGITTSSYGEDVPTIERTAKIQGTIYLFFGTRDTLVSQEESQQIEAELDKQQIDYRLFRYDAGHGFFAGFFEDKYPFLKQHPSYNSEAAPHAWQQVLELFQNNLSDWERDY